nr:archaeosortase/exosortase family protein [Algibacter amylolyticus]
MHFKKLYKLFPFTVRLIFIKALLFYVLCKFLFSLDLRAVNYHLSENIGTYSTKVLNTFTNSSNFSVKREYAKKYYTELPQIYFNDIKVVYIADGCNGLFVLMLYMGLIFCFPSKFWRKILYLISGILIIHILNIFRCAGLAYINLHHQTYFDLAHRYLLKWAIYSVIVIIWMFYIRNIQFNFKTLNKQTNLV